ncbi:NAD(P)-dependent alcohol dehydrogenase [Agrobacterium tumefaciens]|uniref:NAD(P)-dependent alcohol dehydrogenase n=1 Tax=Agrobacterium tumefaciens TaxID=358 RepID=UPI0021D1AC01|nr:NAD(P)-dependent alcohol dehydrogenase [Agrobacterium tumefaciens]UXT22293.1 NAD(P)-dependent alcohol dehydrogenase [Agrobacterium tumefaciens]
MFTTSAYACDDGSSPMKLATIKRRDPGPRDVEIEIEFCGVCHSDIHTARSEWPGSLYPCVPGHEIIGRVGRVGSQVTRFKAGDRVGVGCIVDSCRECASCAEGLEQYCENGMTGTYNSPDKAMGGGAHTLGGYSAHVVVDDRYVLNIPEGLDPAAAAPLLCAGITTYSPLRHWNAGPGKRVGVVGLGGLGHMAVKLANAMGATVVMITTSPGKAEDAKKLGAHEVIVSRDAEQMKNAASSLDLIIDAVAADHDINAYLALLKRDGALVQVGAPEKPLSVMAFSLIPGRKTFAGSMIGGIPETQEMLDFCADKGIAAEIEMIDIDQINDAYERMIKSDVRYRFVIDMKSLPREKAA